MPLTAICQKTDVNVIVLILLVSYRKKSLLRFLEVARSGLRLGVVEVKIILIGEIRFYRVQVQPDPLELSVEEEKGSHALSTGYSVALRRRRADQLEILLGGFYAVALEDILAISLRSIAVRFNDDSNDTYGIGLLADNGVDYALQNVFLRNCGLQIFNQIVGRFHVILLQVIYYQIKPGLRNDVHQIGQNLKSILTTAKYLRTKGA